MFFNLKIYTLFQKLKALFNNLPTKYILYFSILIFSFYQQNTFYIFLFSFFLLPNNISNYLSLFFFNVCLSYQLSYYLLFFFSFFSQLNILFTLSWVRTGDWFRTWFSIYLFFGMKFWHWITWKNNINYSYEFKSLYFNVFFFVRIYFNVFIIYNYFFDKPKCDI